MIKNKEMLFINFPPIGKITPKVKEENSKRVFTGGVRIGNSMYRTDEETKNTKKDLCRESCLNISCATKTKKSIEKKYLIYIIQSSGFMHYAKKPIQI